MVCWALGKQHRSAISALYCTNNVRTQGANDVHSYLLIIIYITCFIVVIHYLYGITYSMEII